MKKYLKAYWAIAKKEIFHITRDTRTLFILFAMPVALVLIFGYTITNEFRGASIGVVDRSGDQLSRMFIDHIRSSGHFKLTGVAPNVEELEQLFKKGDVKMGIVVGPDFEKQFYGGTPANVQLIMDATEPNYAATLHSYALQMISSFNARYKAYGNGQVLDVNIVRSTT